jgi:hypothetical protein
MAVSKLGDLEEFQVYCLNRIFSSDGLANSHRTSDFQTLDSPGAHNKSQGGWRRIHRYSRQVSRSEPVTDEPCRWPHDY